MCKEAETVVNAEWESESVDQLAAAGHQSLGSRKRRAADSSGVVVPAGKSGANKAAGKPLDADDGNKRLKVTLRSNPGIPVTRPGESWSL